VIPPHADGFVARPLAGRARRSGTAGNVGARLKNEVRSCRYGALAEADQTSFGCAVRARPPSQPCTYSDRLSGHEAARSFGKSVAGDAVAVTVEVIYVSADHADLTGVGRAVTASPCAVDIGIVRNTSAVIRVAVA